MHFTWWWNRWRAPKFFYFFFFFFFSFLKNKENFFNREEETRRIVHHRQPPPRTPVLYTCVQPVIGRERAKQRDCGHKMCCPINFKWGKHTAPKEEEEEKENDGRRKREKWQTKRTISFSMSSPFFFKFILYLDFVDLFFFLYFQLAVTNDWRIGLFIVW
jgi:hypothetical protein